MPYGLPDHPLGGTIYIDSKQLKECPTCGRSGQRLQTVYDGRYECAHIECPLRNRTTAQSSEKSAGSPE